MQMTFLPPNSHNALMTSGTWVSFLCLREASCGQTWSCVGLRGGRSQLGTLSRKHQEVPGDWSLLSQVQTLRTGL